MKNYLNDAINSICESVRFDSSRKDGTREYPFGKSNYDCLCHFLSLAESMGFQTKNYDGYVGEVLFGEGEEFAILAHLDVVPAGDGWTKPPFAGEVSEGRIWGRGTIDDKGPAICTLYAMKALKDSGFEPKKKIKLIVGCNEECGWACMEHYNKVAHMPETGFSPDADFPVIFSEKGIADILFRFPVPHVPLTFMEGGSAANMVCDACTVQTKLTGDKLIAKYNLKKENGRLVAHGKSAHGSTPERGENAILPLLCYLREADGETENGKAEIEKVIACLFDDVYGLKTLYDGIDRLTLSPNLISYENGALLITCDVRYPAGMTLENVLEKVRLFGVPFEITHHQAPLRLAKDSPLVSTLLKVFETCTGTKAEPVSIGGGTYARALKYGVAFGPEMPGDEPVVHQPNEYITLERVELLLNIYKKAIEELTK